jgi:RNA polymerase sigma factor (sigma-70 family)
VPVDSEPHRGCSSVDNALHSDSESFFKAHYYNFLVPVARRYAGFRSLPAELAEDIASEAMTRTLDAWDEKQFEHATCARRLGFICVTMSNVASEEWRKHSKALPTDPQNLRDIRLSTRENEPGERAVTAEALRIVTLAYSTLSEHDREILDLAVAGLSRRSIADQLGLTTTNVTTKLNRIRDHLAQNIGPFLSSEIGRRARTNRHGGSK